MSDQVRTALQARQLGTPLQRSDRLSVTLEN